MELLASIKALEQIKLRSKILLITDSKYLIDGVTNWIENWKSNNWKKSDNKDVKNKEFWVKLDYFSRYHEVSWKWVKGHSGNEFNEEADKIARKEAEKL